MEEGTSPDSSGKTGRSQAGTEAIILGLLSEAGQGADKGRGEGEPVREEEGSGLS